MNRWIKIWLVPGAVFQSVMVSGGYGSGREVVEFVSQFGPWNGLVSLAFIGLAMGLTLAISYDLARKFGLRDYKSFSKLLLGRCWIMYELMFIVGLLLVLAVAGSAAGGLLEDNFGWPASGGTALMLLIVAVLTYSGRQWVEKSFTLWALLMNVFFISFLVMSFLIRGEEIRILFGRFEFSWEGDWTLSGFKFFLYSAALAPAIIYAADHIEIRRQAWGAGLVAGLLAVIPGIVFHLAFMADYPAVINQDLPTYWMVQQLGSNALLLTYVLVLFGTIAQTGVGVLQGFNERLDSWWQGRRGKTLSPKIHSIVAATSLLVSMVLAKVGIVAIVAEGYGSLAWFSLAIFVLPLFTIGVWKALKKRKNDCDQKRFHRKCRRTRKRYNTV